MSVLPAVAVHPTTESSADIDWLSRDSCDSYCERRRDQLKKDEEAIELMRDKLIRTQKETVVNGLCKLNKDVKKMTVKEFNSTFGCDVIDLIARQMAAGDVHGSNGGKKRNRVAGGVAIAAAAGTGLSLKTPAAHRSGKPPMTMRTARRGEVLKSYSVNGSPVDQFDHGEVVVTAKKRRGGNGQGHGAGAVMANDPSSFPISIGIGAGNGETIDLSDPNQRKNLDGQQKKQAMQQLMAIQEQMNQLMADF
eukprot:CAMPEP_0181127692 /NCGR_PEP_ID=MMETSP1071-20121207/28336_1 /TAXON_ID=35127 /ORGANISM="Thalassiosira sp., Strain NH16" /LENGTH=249 /DNA_ID=CAMNT_0023213453 /DNA_START=130 /DNA_END=879 /DNA_ORIENTATION=-